jgi:RNA polymerase-binding transcription factor DksA
MEETDDEDLTLASLGLTREEANAYHVNGLIFENEADHFYICEWCGQAVDYRRLGDVLYHDEPDHTPLPLH